MTFYNPQKIKIFMGVPRGFILLILKPIISYMTRDEYLELYERYLSGNAGPEEIELLFEYKDKFDIAQFDDEVTIPDQELIQQRIYGHIEQQINKQGRI